MNFAFFHIFGVLESTIFGVLRIECMSTGVLILIPHGLNDDLEYDVFF